MSCDIGLYGLAVMGQNFALNMAEHGFRVAVCNRSPAKVDTTVERAKNEGNLPLVRQKAVKDFVAECKKPRKIVILVQAGKGGRTIVKGTKEHMPVLKYGGWSHLFNTRRHLSPIL